jgi:hypothetical protein
VGLGRRREMPSLGDLQGFEKVLGAVAVDNESSDDRAGAGSARA